MNYNLHRYGIAFFSSSVWPFYTARRNISHHWPYRTVKISDDYYYTPGAHVYAAHAAFPGGDREGYAIIWDMVNST